MIVASARAVFAEQGFAGATTREIATRARASEVLIFRYFGSKAGLFEAIVIEPFNELLSSFLATQVDYAGQLDRRRNSEQFVSSFFEFLSSNADLLQALAKSSANGGAEHMHGLDVYFRRSSARLRRVFAEEGAEPEVDPELSVRFLFGMLAAAVLFREWFFPDGGPDAAVQKKALARLIFNAQFHAIERIRDSGQEAVAPFAQLLARHRVLPQPARGGETRFEVGRIHRRFDGIDGPRGRGIRHPR